MQDLKHNRNASREIVINRPLPEHDRIARLQQLGILDTAKDGLFCELAGQALIQLPGTSIAAITLVDTHRQWFKTIIGLDLTETPRHLSFCSHTIQGPGVMVVEDATQDARFAVNPMVTAAPHIRFYAGVGLMDGVGALCVLGHQPRQASDAEMASLHKLAQFVDIQLMAHGTLHNVGATPAPYAPLGPVPPPTQGPATVLNGANEL